MKFSAFIGTPGKMTPVQQAQIEALGATILPADTIMPPAAERVVEWLEGIKTEAIQRLKAAKAIASNSLAQSINVKPVNISEDSFVIILEADNYWKFVDLGVKGAKSAARAPSSPFKYKGSATRFKTWRFSEEISNTKRPSIRDKSIGPLILIWPIELP